MALGKAGFTVKRFDGASLPNVALDKGMGAFAECMGHSAKRVADVVSEPVFTWCSYSRLGYLVE